MQILSKNRTQSWHRQCVRADMQSIIITEFSCNKWPHMRHPQEGEYSMSSETLVKLSSRLATICGFIVCVLSLAWSSSTEAQGSLSADWQYNPMTASNSVVYSADGTMVAVGGAGGAKIYSASTGTPLRGLPTDANTVILSVAFSPDGKTLACAGVSLVK
jgi:WD40 repeat protein